MNDHWHWPQYVVLSLYLLRIFIHAAYDGKPIESQKYSFGMSVCAACASGFILWMGGFFA